MFAPKVGLFAVNLFGPSGAVSGTLGHFIEHPISRIGLGAAIGGVMGYDPDSSNLEENVLGKTALGAAAGLGLGLLTVPSVFMFGAGQAWNLGKTGVKYGLRGAIGSVGLAGDVANFVTRNPGLSTTMIGGGLGLYGLSSYMKTKEFNYSGRPDSPNLPVSRFNKSSHRRFRESAEGLTFGLHQGRHS